MKVLAIIGSLRKGNTLDVVQEVEKHMKELGEVEFEYLFLKDANLELCKGCFNCLTKGDEFCPIKDDRVEIEKRMLESDGVILASPVYVHNMTWMMKNFFDRFAYSLHRPRFFNQCMMLVSTTGGTGLKQAQESMAMLAASGFNLVSRIALVTPPFPLPEKDQVKRRKLIRKESEEFFASMLKSDRHMPEMGSIMQFQAMRIVFSYAKDYFPCDYNYWKEKGWLDDKKYFTNSRLSIAQRTGSVFTGLFLKMMLGRSMSKMDLG